jgi:alanyl-tRNA synthetase
VRLDRTAFYPTSGGQPHDLGTLDGTAVKDVWDDEGEVWHLLEGPLEGEEVQGRVDWARRLDHMQQHTGQHLLSAAFVRVLDAPTVGFHLGTESSTIDLELPHLHEEAAHRVEDEVNRVIWENRPVIARFVGDEELASLNLRREPQVEGPIRVVSVEGYDASPCGGTHLTRTGAVGQIKITGLERYKGGTRVTFLCGQRALRDYRRALGLLQETAEALTVGQGEVPEAVARVQEEARETRRALHKAQETLREVEGEELWQRAPVVDGVKRILAYWPGRSPDDLRAVASRLREHPSTLLLLATSGEGGVRIVCARSDDLEGVDAAAMIRDAAGALGGRGGGSPTLAQGGAPPASEEEVLAALNAAVPAL